MKKLIAFLLLLAPSAYALTYDSGGSTGGSAFNTSQTILGIGNEVVVRKSTMSSTQTGAVESAAFHDTVFYNGTNGAELPAGYWIDFFYNQSGAVTTAHGGAIFARTHGNVLNQGFLFSVEGNTLCTSTFTTAACTSLIAHTKFDSPTSLEPGGPIIGVNSRIDLTTDGFGTAPLALGTVMHFRPDPGSIGGRPGMRFGYYTTDADLQIVNAGNIFKIPISSAAVNGGTLDVSHSCGGTLVLTSTAIITMSATSFTAASSNATNGTYNDGCEIQIINANLVSGRTITFQHNNSGLLTFNASSIAVGALGGSFRIASIASAGVWTQTTLVTESAK